ncbi:MAG: flagellar biosynthesis protein FlhG [Clostridia bacterium]|nr:flagellar biosynthesis protein FlhG [Clostridia bacterium]
MMVDQAEKLRKLAMTTQNKTGKTGESQMRVITVASGKGGVGKTSIVVNLAIELSRAGKKVMILDADLGLANVDIMFGIIPRYTLYDVFLGKKSLQEIVLDGPEGIKIIPGGSGIHELANIGYSERERLMADLKDFSRELDYLIIDCGAGVSKNVLGFISAADDVVIVITPEPTSITDAYGIIKIISKFQLHTEVYIVINKAGTVREACETARKIETVAGKYLEIKVRRLGFISDDLTVGKSVKEQKPYCVSHPNSKVAKDISQMAHNLIQKRMQSPQGTDNFFLKLFRIFK